MKIKIQSFAELKEYFNAELSLELEPGVAVSELILKLEELNSKAIPALKRSRIAVDMEFVTRDYKIKEHDIVYLVPPSSGG